MKRKSTFLNYKSCLNTQLTQPHQNRSLAAVYHKTSKDLYFEISYSQPPIVTMHFKETGLQIQKGVFLYICFIHCNSQLDISEYIYMYNKNKISNEIYKTCLIMHVFNASSSPELHTGAINPVTVYIVWNCKIPTWKTLSSQYNFSLHTLLLHKYCFTSTHWITNVFINTEMIK